MFDPLNIGSLIETQAELAEAGMAAEAAELRRSLVEFLDGQIAHGLDHATDAIGRDPAYASECLLKCMMTLRVYWSYVGGLPESYTRCLTTTAAFCASLGQDEAAAIAREMASGAIGPFYPVTESCQIGILDGLLQRCFGRVTQGQFVEVGAYDGESFSNTCGLADIGWRGLYIEPSPASYERCRARHAKNAGIETVNFAIGATVSRVSMSGEGPLTQVAAEGEKALFEVALSPLDDVLAERNIAPGFDLLVVDVEGFEGEVFAGFDLARWLPSAIIIELSDLAPLEPSKIQLRDRLLATGYRLLFQDAVNSLYVLELGAAAHS
jgi:FkbM family methyltransferase